MVTGGSEGAAGYGAGGEVSVRAEPVEVVDTIGAGDSFNAGLLTWLRAATARSTAPAIEGLSAGRHVADALAFAGRVAAVTCSRPGADPPRLAELGTPDVQDASMVRVT